MITLNRTLEDVKEAIQNAKTQAQQQTNRAKGYKETETGYKQNKTINYAMIVAFDFALEQIEAFETFQALPKKEQQRYNAIFEK